jgi:hypothetical protein
MKYIFVFAVGLLIYSLSNNRSDQKSSSDSNSDKFFEINYEKLLENKQVIGLVQVASKVEYVKLETKNDCVIGRGANYFFTDSLIFVSNRDHVLKFSHSGKFLGRIGKSGKGPEEIDILITMSVIPDKKLIVVQKDVPKKLMYFTFDGKFVKAVSIPRYGNLKVLNDERYIAYNSGDTGIDEYNFLLTNATRDTLSFVKNNDKWRNTAPMTLMIEYPFFEPFYSYKNRWYLKSVYNDTVYYVSGDKIAPGYVINLGKYKLPPELRPERVLITDTDKKELLLKKRYVCYYCNVSEVADKIFLTTSNFKHNDAKFFLIDENNKSGYLLINEDSKSTGIVNDWDGGLDFWPKGNVNDHKVFMPIDIVTFQKTLKENKENKGSVKYPEKQSQLQKMVSDSKITDNPILVVVTLKNSL